MEDPLSEEVQLGSSIHLAFEELESSHLALCLSIAVREFAGRTYAWIVLQAPRKALQVG